MRTGTFRLVSAIVVLLVAVSDICRAENYTTLNLPRISDGQMVYLINVDNEAVLDSLPAINQTVVFRSDKHKPSYVKVKSNNEEYGNFLLNDSPITLDVTVEDFNGGVLKTWIAHGGFNDSFKDIAIQYSELYKDFQNASNDQVRDSLQNTMQTLLLDNMARNVDNILGYRLFLMLESKLSLGSIENLLNRYPALKNYEKVNATLAEKRIIEDVQPGHRFKDFTVSYEGVEHRLSDIVGKGDYVLVDFWAFWCGPCREEMPYIKEVYNQFKNRNFKVIGITISDNPEMDIEAAEKLELTWEIWVNGFDASKEYSISSIPHLILFGPDGTILERGIRGDALLPAVTKYFD